MKIKKTLTSKKQKSGKENGCSAQTEQPNQSISEKPSETDTTLIDLDEESKHIVLPLIMN